MERRKPTEKRVLNACATVKTNRPKESKVAEVPEGLLTRAVTQMPRLDNQYRISFLLFHTPLNGKNEEIHREVQALRKIVSITVLMAIVLSCAMLAIRVYAYDDQNPPPHNPYAWAEDVNSVMTDVFQLGQPVVIRAMSSNTPFTVKLYDPDGTEVKSWTSTAKWFTSGAINYGTNKLGKWVITVNDAKTKYAVGQYDVISDVPFGALGAVAACFAGLSVKALRPKHTRID